MNDVVISFKNYKLLKEGELNLSGGSIFFAQGPNNVGKTSFLNLIQSIMEVKDETKNPVTFGEKEGFCTGHIPGADGKLYQYRYDFNIDGKSKFQFIDPDNKVIKTVGDMRAIFNYTHFTMEEFFDWSKSVPGRKKQRDIFMNLLSEKERNEIIDIENKINPTSGEFIASRRALNTEIDFLQKKVDTSILTIDEKNLLSMKNDIDSLYTELENKKLELENIINGSSVSVERIKSIREQLQQLADSNTEFTINNNKQIEDIDIEIEKLKAKKEELISSKETYLNTYQKKKEAFNIELDELNKSGGLTPEDLQLKADELKITNDRLKTGKEKKDAIIKIETKDESTKYEIEQLQIKIIEANKFDEKIKTLREKKKTIITNSENIPIGWSLGDDYITINNIPFTETDLSKSEATKAIAELMMKVNKAPVMLMGDAESLGYEVLDNLLVTAKEMGKIMIFAEHSRSVRDFQLICYDELEHEKPETKKLF